MAKGGEARGGIPGISVGNPPAPAPPWRHSARPSECLPVGSRRLGWGTPAGTRSCPSGSGCSRPQLAVILHFGLWMQQRVAVAPLGFAEGLQRVDADGDSGEAQVLVPRELQRARALVAAALPEVAHGAQEGPALPQGLGGRF